MSRATQGTPLRHCILGHLSGFHEGNGASSRSPLLFDMLPVLRLLAALLGIVLDLVVVWVNWPLGGTLPIILLAAQNALDHFNVAVINFILPAINSDDFAASTDNGTDFMLEYSAPFAAACNTSSFITSAMSVAGYGASAALAIELYSRTSSRTLVNMGFKNLTWARTWLYVFLSVILPVVDIAVLFIFRYGTGAHYLKGAYCDIEIPPLPLLLIYIAVTAALTATGSFFTIYAIVTYARRRSAILALLAEADARPPIECSATTAASTAPRTTDPTLTGAVRGLNEDELHSRAHSTALVLLRALRRMAMFAVVFHVIAIYTVANEVLLVIKYWGQPRVGAGAAADVGNAVINMYIWLATAVGIFVCFATGSHAMDRYRAAFRPLWRKRAGPIKMEERDDSFHVELDDFTINSSPPPKISERHYGRGAGVSFTEGVEV
ncbi:hypothetical protein HK101_007349 [Irineochytrium annulatum]|nr:hypothetical protein HK101_007349 [Irineochytrium annulatum]